jgi:DNA replication protein DnaC
MAARARVDILVLGDLGLQPVAPARAADLLEVIEDRAGPCSTIVTSQLPVGHWHEAPGELLQVERTCQTSTIRI